MDKEETLKLLFEGRDAWNAWAERKLAEKSRLDASGASLAVWREKATADLTGFGHRKLDCSDFIFPGVANFSGITVGASSFVSAKFFGKASFTSTIFAEGAAFNDAKFDEGVNFAKASFRQFPAEFARIEVSGDACFEEASFDVPTSFEQCKFCGLANFTRAAFLQAAGFDNARFVDDATFLATVFSRNASWFGARFTRSAVFPDAVFSGPARFDGVEFEGPATFTEAQFSDNASFRKAKFLAEANFTGTTFQETFNQLINFSDTEFLKKVDFQRARFRGLARFRNSHFHKAASFTAIAAETSFDMSEAHFQNDVPSFIQAHFPEAPRLDHIRVPSVPELCRAQIELGPYVTAKYRALKRLAIQGHDHDREHQFFADELRSLRGNPDRPWHARYWIGFLYEVISNFGRSISRPIVCWIVLTMLFAGMYLCIYLRVTQAGSCADGHGNPVSQAIYLSVKKGLVFPGLGGDQRVDEALKCLYGGAVLDSVSYAGIIQSLVSAILIFLFLLAVRNRFRIK